MNLGGDVCRRLAKARIPHVGLSRRRRGTRGTSVASVAQEDRSRELLWLPW